MTDKGSDVISAEPESTWFEKALSGLKYICTCDNPCACMGPYEVRVTAITRVAGIPVAGVRLEFPKKDPRVSRKQTVGNEKNDLVGSFMSGEKEMTLRLVYANEAERMKTETVTITLKNLLPTCIAAPKSPDSEKSATAEFEHFIPKIRDIQDLPEETEAMKAASALEEATIALDQAIRAHEVAQVQLRLAQLDLAWGMGYGNIIGHVENLVNWLPIRSSPKLEALLRDATEAAQKKVDAATKNIEDCREKVKTAHEEYKKVEEAQKAAEKVSKEADDAKDAKMKTVDPTHVDEDFEDTYTTKATKYTEAPSPDSDEEVATAQAEPTAPTAAAATSAETATPASGKTAETPSIKKPKISQIKSSAKPYYLVESALEVEKTKDGKIIFHLNVSLATFNLAVPYMNQNAGDVEGGLKTGTDKKSRYMAWHKPVGAASTTRSSWRGEVLCAPTSATMILMYYGVETGDRALTSYRKGTKNSKTGKIEYTEETLSDKRLLNRAGLIARFLGLKGQAPWQLAGNMLSTVLRVYNEKYPEDAKTKTRGAVYSPAAVPFPEKRTFAPFMQTFFPLLCSGHPIYASIRGDHLLVVRGAVVSHEEKEIWAICNDPYGTLAGPQSDYEKFNAKDSWYQRRIERNENNQNDTANAVKGKNVCYNHTTHTRTKRGGTGDHFNFKHASTFKFRLMGDADKSDEEFVSGKLVRGGSR